jgi:anti-sigma regulatory factor (Ser/Thr protein kinase)/NAD-dependent dihydropyrimidine dehydrogenase PreA subunit
MNGTSYAITGGDFERVGAASSSLKQRLKQLGIAPSALRRVLVAAYEAEANVVVHAHKGTLRAVLSPSRVDIEVADEGPGIPDVEQAMKQGYSTAPPAAMALGFGAGMGLPNIKKNSDSFAIESEVGRGTRVCFSIHLSRQKVFGPLSNSLQVVRELCRACMRCLHVCPTHALRVRRNGPEILEHLCIDCAACIEACPSGALSLPSGVGLPRPSEHTILAIPASFLVGFGPNVSAGEVLDALSAMGFHRIRVLEEWEAALRGTAFKYAREQAEKPPVFSPVCPAVVNLIEMRFPSLIPHLAPFLSPIEAIRQELECEHLVVGVSCSAQYTALRTGRPSERLTLVSLSRLRTAVLHAAARGNSAPRSSSQQFCPEGRADPSVLRVTGLRHVVGVLDRAENGLLADFVLVELLACDQGCFGATVAGDEPFVAHARWRRMANHFTGPAKAVRREVPFVARPGMRLDDDMSRAIEKLSRMDRLVKELPGKNCGMCGAPTCSALAEDVVLGRTDITACPYRVDGPGRDE